MEDLYVGQFMVYNATSLENERFSFSDDLGRWDENDGFGFAYIYDENETSPYLGLAMFDESGHTNNMVSFDAGGNIEWSGTEKRFATTMRNGIIQEEASNPGLHSILSASGPFDIAPNSTIYPFKLAIVVGETVDELKDAVMSAHTKSFNITNLSEEIQRKDLDVNPNPFNDFARIKFHLDKAEDINLELVDVTGQKLWSMFRIKQPEGDLTAELDGSHLPEGLYFLKVTTESERHTIRLLHLED